MSVDIKAASVVLMNIAGNKNVKTTLAKGMLRLY